MDRLRSPEQPSLKRRHIDVDLSMKRLQRFFDLAADDSDEEGAVAEDEDEDETMSDKGA